MGYESEIYIVRQYKDDKGKVLTNQVLTMLDMSKMGYDFDYKKAFPNELEGEMCMGRVLDTDMGDYDYYYTDEDCYGKIHTGTIDTALNELKKHLGNDYYMFDVLYATLTAYKAAGLNNLIVAQYGY